MTHTYLLEPGVWIARGTLLSSTGERSFVDGSATITHFPDRWLMHSRLGGFTNDYELEPLVAGRTATSWTSHNPGLGSVRGVMVFVGDSILSSFSIEGGMLHGFEYLRQTGPDTYENRGTLVDGDAPVSSWVVSLTRVGAAGDETL